MQPQNPPQQPPDTSRWRIYVIFIIAILLAIAIPTFLGARDSANARTEPTPTPPQNVALAPPQATATTAPKPTATTAPASSCQVFIQGRASPVVGQAVNLDTGTGDVSSSPQAGDDIEVSPSATGAPQFAPLYGATMYNMGTTANFSALTCSELMGLRYTSDAVPSVAGQVFAVKTPSGHYVKVEVGSSALALQWVTYKP